MGLQIYNSMTRAKEPFEPLDPAGAKVTMYNCGPTVYDHFHIGNARNFVVMDMARRYLQRRYNVTFVQNLTDVDDKIIDRARREEKTFDEIRTTYMAAYFEDSQRLRVQPADRHPCATEFIPQMIELIERLVARGLAYESMGNVYYRVRRFPDYGKLAGRNLDDQQAGARVEVSEVKEDPFDFVLWKPAKLGEPAWPSPWGEGRPGWHLECSTMAMNLLGETIDIHSGGHDLMFPHHENEIAQSEGATGRPFARYWMHNGFLNIDGEKMSKSLGNIMKIHDVLAHHPVEAVRYFLLSAHYRQRLDYNEAALGEAASAVRRINEGIATGEKILSLAAEATASTESVAPFVERFEGAMDDDFNTPQALAIMHELVSAIHEERQKPSPDNARLAALVGEARRLRDFFSLEPGTSGAEDGNHAEIRGIYDSLRKQADEAGVTAGGDQAPEGKAGLIEGLIEVRRLARKKKVFALADQIRSQLAAAGIALEDHAQGTIWKETERFS